MDTFEELLAEGAAVPVEGWDFSWFAGRATEARPSWGYARLIGERMAGAAAALDVQTGGGEVLATVARAPALLVATESWRPNVPVAARNLRPLGASVVEAGNSLPFRDAVFDLVVSRHPVHTPWDEVARVLRPGGTFLSQQIGAGTNRELSEAMLGPLPPPEPQHFEHRVAAAGLTLVDLRAERLPVEFFDVAAVAYFLRKVVWTVPGFSVERFRPQLRAVHERIVRQGVFRSSSRRVLVEAVKPG
ncbi:class I SAM-dependent methyltransferase [Couchioplanes caeruleus]|uniref:class I SAM-dependent methyltransferase n=1 Tax=Couchioplanes caeruleus TaxID=56438 RepID=UPI0020BDD693|nr:class I SAM-dependent methyltransferase [Couchioplanes caeruleus]UQU65671.1 class I SAM-dependent methyltransferase [Couchioplanes caeruleus]